MIDSSSKAKATAFHQLHRADHVLILPNCWDALSAVVLREAGAKAIATTSAEKTGARRLSLGARLSEAVFGRLKQLAIKLLHDRSLDELFTESLSFAEINKLLS
jgi:2-methylisocitrate lyase-like PEP mutase family enzyme